MFNNFLLLNFIFRIFFAFGTDYMLEYAWIKILGGLALLWIVYNIRQDLFGKNKIKSPELKSKEPVSFRTGVYRILIADITLSFDNVLGVVGAAKDYYYLMITGLLLSVFLVATLATYFANYNSSNAENFDNVLNFLSEGTISIGKTGNTKFSSSKKVSTTGFTLGVDKINAENLTEQQQCAPHFFDALAPGISFGLI